MSFRHASLGLVFAVAAPAVLAQQGYRNKPIHLVATYFSGSSVDIIARLIAKPMSDQMGQRVAVENKPGAGGDITTDFVANAPKDGHTIGFASPSPPTTIAATKLRAANDRNAVPESGRLCLTPPEPHFSASPSSPNPASDHRHPAAARCLPPIRRPGGRHRAHLQLVKSP